MRFYAHFLFKGGIFVIKDFISKADARGVKLRVVPISCLSYIKDDLQKLAASGNLNSFQSWIVQEKYALDAPQDSFRSIIIAAMPLRLVNLEFKQDGKSVRDVLGVSPTGAYDCIKELAEGAGHTIETIEWLPMKRLGVCSGLSEYGRNNITYIDGLGSFFELSAYLTDMECDDYTWREAKASDVCGDCNKCVANCPTGAILPERFLIDNEKCLTRHNEWGSDPFPDWIPKSAHHSITGCWRCQRICPLNAGIFDSAKETVVFDDEETALLLSSTPFEQLPPPLLDKMNPLDMGWLYESLPRNLKAMFDNA